jgi:hypothetical protein
METPAQRCARLVGAFEDLAGQEAAAVAAGDFEAVAAVQARIEPAIAFLVANANFVSLGSLRTRIADASARRQETARCLADQLARTREALGELKTNQRRLARVAPVYGRSDCRTERRFVAVG